MSGGDGPRRILLLGYLVRGPLGGLAWHHLQYVAGLARLGHDVVFLEDSDDYPSCYDPSRNVTSADPSYGLAFAKATFARLGLGENWAYYDAHEDSWRGPASSTAYDRCRHAELLINLSAVNPLREWHLGVETRVLLDTDPGFTQAKILSDPTFRGFAKQHTHFLSFAASLGNGAALPDDGIAWAPTRQPVVIDAWPWTAPPSGARFTTVMQWESYPEARFGGRTLGLKSRSFGAIDRLPGRFPGLLELALGGPRAAKERLLELGWCLTDPIEVTRDPWTFQDYLRGSVGEFSVAKEGYVATRSGWFSERSTSYMAMGRPVVVEDTGFTQWLPTGEGVLAFSDEESAAAGLDAVLTDPVRHGAAARDLVHTYFNSDDILNELVESVSGQKGASG